MRAKVVVLVGALLAGSGVIGVAPAALPVMGATNVITGDHPGSMSVRVPALATADVTFGADVTITGGGRFAGITMTDSRGAFGNQLTALRFNQCTSSGCASTASDQLGWVGVPGSKRTFETRVMAGDYRLQLITDGTPVRVVLTLHGLTGTTSLTPLGATDLRVMTMPERFVVGRNSAQPVYTAAGVGQLASRGGLIATRFWFSGQVFVAGDLGACVIRNPSGRYLPECPEGNIITDFPDLNSQLKYKNGLYGFFSVWGGRWAEEDWYTAAATVKEAHATALWISY